MSKITLSSVGSIQQNPTTAQSEINTNFSTIQTAFDNTLSRDGTAPNQMGASLDMNSNQILNLPTPTDNFNPLRLIDVTTLNGAGTINVSPVPTGGTTGQVLSKNSNTNYDIKWSNPGSGATSVGLSLPADFTVTGSPVTSAGTLTAVFATTPTGTGAFVRATSPTLVTPVLNAATGTAITLSSGLAVMGGTAPSNGIAVGATTVVSGVRNGIQIFGSDNGAGAGTSVVGNNGASTNWAIGNGFLGGAYDGSLLHFSGGAQKFYTGGSNLAGFIDTSQHWGIGTSTSIMAASNAPPLTISLNAAAAPDTSGAWSPTLGRALAQFVGVDSKNVAVIVSSFGGGEAAIHLTNAGGSGASPIGTTLGTHMGTYNIDGYHSDGTPGYLQGVALLGRATDNWTTTTTGSALDIYCTPATTATIAKIATFDNTTSLGLTQGLNLAVGNLSFGTSGKGVAGTTTNDSAGTGIVGEFVSSTVALGSAVSLVTNTAKDVTTISLTAGDWDVSGWVGFIPAGTTSYTQMVVSNSATLNTLDTTPGSVGQLGFPATVNGGVVNGLLTPPTRVSINSTTTYHLVAQAAFTVSTMTAYGIIRARRVR